jgi:transcriptional regulator with XRE-family HTH domain
MPSLQSPMPRRSPPRVRTRISERLSFAVRTANVRQYQLAQRIEVHPSTLSAWLNGIFPVQHGDQRVVQLGDILGVPANECFEESAAGEAAGDK